MRRPGTIELANEKVTIGYVCRRIGLDIPDDARRKLPCPFGELYHSDGGIDPAMRVYSDNNTAYCFSCSSYFTPVSLAARAWGVPFREAATRLLDEVGYRPLSLPALWEQAQVFEPDVDRAHLAEALKIYCRRIDPNWGSRQFEPAVAGQLTRCLQLLDKVCNSDDVRLWLETCKEAMRRQIAA